MIKLQKALGFTQKRFLSKRNQEKSFTKEKNKQFNPKYSCSNKANVGKNFMKLAVKYSPKYHKYNQVKLYLYA